MTGTLKPMDRGEARQRVVQMLDTLYNTPDFLRVCDACVVAMTRVQMEVYAQRGGYTPAQYARLTKCVRCDHARFQHRKNSLTGNACYLCECDGWSTAVDDVPDETHHPPG